MLLVSADVFHCSFNKAFCLETLTVGELKNHVYGSLVLKAYLFLQVVTRQEETFLEILNECLICI